MGDLRTQRESKICQTKWSTLGNTGNIAFAVRKKPSLGTAGSVAHAVSFVYFNIGFFDHFHILMDL